MGFWVTLAVYVGLYVISKYVIPKTPAGRKDRRTQDDSPTVRDGVTIPIWYGKCRFDAPNLVWNSARRKVNDPAPAVDQGAFAANMMFVLGIPGGVLSPNFPNYNRKVTWDDLEINGVRLVRSGSVFGEFYSEEVEGFDYSFAPFTETSGIFSLRPQNNLEAIVGKLIIRDGFYDTGPYGCGEFASATGNDPNLWPAYRHQTTMLACGLDGPHTPAEIAADSFRKHFIYSRSPDLPSIIVTMTNPCSLDMGGGHPEILPVDGSNPNPVAVLYDILTNDWARVGLPDSAIDKGSFSIAASTLDAEGHGWGGFLTDPENAADVIREIMAQVNGILYQDPQTRLLRLKLVRYDYVVGSLPLFDESNVGEVLQFMTSTFNETYNQVRVTYTDASSNFATKTAVAQDLANVSAQGGRVRAVTIDFPHIRNSGVAASVAARELNEVSLPLASLKIRTNRDAFTLRPGDVFRFRWTELNMVDVVFRVQHIDLGQPGDEEIVVDVLQDIFSFDFATIGVPEVGVANAPILPIQERTFTESPRYFTVQAQASGYISDPNQGRLWYLATPAQTESTGFEIYEYDDDFDRVVADMFPFGPVAYPARAQVNTSYSRTLDPYDTSTGLQIKNVSDTTFLRTASVTDIRTRGKNLVIVGQEVMAYETFTDLGSGVYRLNNVWRGLFDSPTTSHVADERVYFLSDGGGVMAQLYVGRKAHQYAGDTANARFQPNLGGVMLGPDEYGVETDRLVARNRQLLPYPPSDMRVNLGKSVSRLDEEGIHVDWKYRSRLTTQVIRGDNASETVPVTTQYRIKVQKAGPLLLTGPTTTVDTRTDEDSFCTTTVAGHGEINAMVTAFDTAEGVESWEPVKVSVTAPPWRNLLANSNFDDALATYTPAWVITTGADRGSDTTLAHSSTSPFYVTADGLNEEIDFSQTVDITGYYPERLTAVLTFYVKVHTTSTDTATVTLSALDSSGTTLTSSTFGPSNPSTAWTKQTLQITNLPANTAKIRVRVQGDHDEDAITTILFADFTLRVGQVSAAELLLNGDFQTGGGSLTSWTTVSGTWTAVTTAGYNGNVVATQTTTGTSELRQDVTLPAGYQFGTAVVTWAQQSDGTGDAGQVIIEARNGSSVVVASASSVAQAITPLQRWAAGQLVLENLPIDTATIRVRLLATADTTSDVFFDDVSLQVHKELDPDQRQTMSFRTPVTQRRPLDRGDWYEAFPSVPLPDYGMFTHGDFIGGAMRGRLGIEPSLDAPSGARIGKFTGLYTPADGGETESFVGSVAELQSTDDGLVSGDRKLFGNFSAAESFSVLAIFRNRLTTTGACGLVGRYEAFVDNLGWSLELNGSGFVQARIEGATGIATAARATAVKDGHPWMAWLIYDAVADQLHCVDPTGVTTVSTASVGEFKTTSDAAFMIGKCESSQACLDGQIDVHMWRQAITTSQAQSIWTHGNSPVAGLLANGRTGTIVLPVTHNADGEVLASYHQTQLPLGRPESTDINMGVAMNIAMTSLVTSSNFRDTVAWPRDGAASVSVDRQAPLGFLDGMSINSTNAAGVRSADFALSATTTVKATWWARTGGAIHDARLELQNSSGVVKGTIDFMVGPEWQRIDHTFTTWDASTANGRIKFYGSSLGTAAQVEIAGPIFVTQSTATTVAVPHGGAVAATALTFSTALTAQFNHEGEIFLEAQGKQSSPGVQRDIVEIGNGVDNNDKRILRYNSSSNAQLVHYDGSGVSNTATAAGTGWAIARTYRGRWQRAGLVEAAATFSGIQRDATLTAGRGATWTASSTAPAQILLPASDLLIYRIEFFARDVNKSQPV